MGYVRAERDGEVAVSTIDRHDDPNTLNARVREEIAEALSSPREEDDRAIVVTGVASGARLGQAAREDIGQPRRATGPLCRVGPGPLVARRVMRTGQTWQRWRPVTCATGRM